MKQAIELFVEEARGVSIRDAAAMLGLHIVGSCAEHPQPCPQCGGIDCFAFNTKKNKWNCRAGSVGGNDAIGMAAHVLDLDVKKRPELLEACAAVLGTAIPVDDGETHEERAARKERLEKRRLENAARAAAQAKDAASFREREQARARGIFEYASASWRRTAVDAYLCRRLKVGSLSGVGAGLRVRISPAETYWHGKDAFGRPADHHSGPAMIGAFEDADRQIIGCHITWIDLSNSPKFRPNLGNDEKCRVLPSKKMRGSKKHGLIPVVGNRDSRRWIVAEGIETVFAVAYSESFRADTLYAAAGDQSNLAGPANKKGRFKHPTLKRTDRNGRERAVMVPAPFPDPERLEDAFPIDGHVRECILLGEWDSEHVATAAAMARAKKRIELLLPDCLTALAWPPEGYGDFCDLVSGWRQSA
ncbi:MAG: P4 alpha zinc-binding domain-containing protein [Hyphomicrobiales bacterium]|nr:P4 alpha zinc-binding domain-containing protein [Hyphomicrobiales bacterium]